MEPNMSVLKTLLVKYGNSSDYDGNVSLPYFFDTYYSTPRFVVETVLAVLAVISNTVALVGIPTPENTRHQSVYHILFINLATANILNCILQWLCNNILFVFGHYIQESVYQGDITMCQLFVYLLGAGFASWGFGIVSTVTMLGFATVQYFAICRPLHHVTIVTWQRVWVFIGCSWVMSTIGGLVPFLVVLLLSRSEECGPENLLKLTNIVIIGGNSSIALVAAMYIVIVLLCIRIYVEIHRLQRRMSQFRFDQHVQSERRAFVTTMILLSTLTTFYLPYIVLYLVSMSTKTDQLMEHSEVIYFMSLLPYCKFFSDPVIYGMRMREVREGCLRLALKCGLGGCVCGNVGIHELLSPASPSVQTTFSMHPMTSVTIN